ncbi:hypothetical protein YN1HA_9790 [Sulfurisphaera ohwakuensis]
MKIYLSVIKSSYSPLPSIIQKIMIKISSFKKVREIRKNI